MNLTKRNVSYFLQINNNSLNAIPFYTYVYGYLVISSVIVSVKMQ